MAHYKIDIINTVSSEQMKLKTPTRDERSKAAKNTGE